MNILLLLTNSINKLFKCISYLFYSLSPKHSLFKSGTITFDIYLFIYCYVNKEQKCGR